MDLRTEVENVLSYLDSLVETERISGNNHAHDAYYVARKLLGDALRGGEDGDPGWNVWVAEDAPAFKSWRKVAWLDAEPDKEVLWRMDKTRYPAEYHRFFEVREDGTYDIEGVFGQRRYRVLPADVTPDEVVQP